MVNRETANGKREKIGIHEWFNRESSIGNRQFIPQISDF
jgi:hypothetical protein